MINNGYHDEKVWASILFQLLISMLIMLEKTIMFEEFSLENNVFIKDLNYNEINIGVWKYIYNGLEYYVPNYGYLLLIDSNFKEIEKFDINKFSGIELKKIDEKTYNDYVTILGI